jgi:hypothetical protein
MYFKSDYTAYILHFGSVPVFHIIQIVKNKGVRGGGSALAGYLLSTSGFILSVFVFSSLCL